MKHVIALLCAAVIAVAQAAGLNPEERQKIDYLIASIEKLPNAEFIRNGTTYDASAAGDHLRLKLKQAQSRIKTAEDFIRYCASTSSVSGEPYKIRFSDGRVVTAEAFLREKLAEVRRP